MAIKPASSMEEVLHHMDDGPIHTAIPDSVTFEKGQAPDMKGESIAFRPEVETVRFDDLNKGKNGIEIEYDEVIVYVEPGEFITWKLVYEDKVTTRMIPWHRIIEIEWGFETFPSDEDTEVEDQ